MRHEWTPAAEAAFLEALAKGYSVSAAASGAGFSRATVYQRRKDNASFAERWDDAYEAGSDVLEDEARRRAVEGTDRPVYQNGKLVGHVREYSDVMLVLMLKARRPEKYRDNAKIEHGLSNSLEALVIRSMAPKPAPSETADAPVLGAPS